MFNMILIFQIKTKYNNLLVRPINIIIKIRNPKLFTFLFLYELEISNLYELYTNNILKKKQKQKRICIL